MLLWLLAGIALLFLAMGLVKGAAALDPRTLLLALKALAATVGVVVGLLLLLSGRIGWLIGLLPLALPFMLRSSSLGRAGLGGGAPFGFGSSGSAPGQTSQVKTRFFDMRLDHETGELDGAVLDGPHAGRQLSELSLAELLAMLPAVRASDRKSGRLLEAYLDRRSPDWRDGAAQTGAGAGSSGRADVGGDPSGAMAAEEALRVLGLNAGASEAEVRAAYHRLIRHLHPDQGGSSFLAAQVNRARDVLLGADHRRS